MPKTPYYKRAVLKISGESFSKEGMPGIDPDELNTIARQIAEASELGTELAVVVGGGNMIRGAELATRVGIAQAIINDPEIYFQAKLYYSLNKQFNRV